MFRIAISGKSNLFSVLISTNYSSSFLISMTDNLLRIVLFWFVLIRYFEVIYLFFSGSRNSAYCESVLQYSQDYSERFEKNIDEAKYSRALFYTMRPTISIEQQTHFGHIK